ncbi:MAG: helix-turn-helix domain-containing protein [Blautia sp.]
MREIRFELDCDTTSRHFHDEMEILYVLSGRVAVMMDDSNFVLGPEDMIVFNPFEHHELYRESGNHILSAFIPMYVLQQENIGNIQCCSYIQQEQVQYFRVLRTKLAILFKSYEDEPEYRRLYGKSQLLGFLAILKQQFEIKKNDWKTTIDVGRMSKALMYMQEHFSEDISIQDVADQVYLSKGHLSREFYKQMGMSFSDYLRKLRLNKAVRCLRSTKLPVTDIALECGFSNTNTMIINFKQEYGETPGTYRKKHAMPEEIHPVKEDTISYMSLLKYAAYEETMLPLHKIQQEPMHLHVNIQEEKGEWRICHRESIDIGFAKFLLIENTRNAVRLAARDIGFRYIFINGLLDDSLDVYHEKEGQAPYLNFAYIDIVIDFLVSLGIRPWIELSGVPLKMVEVYPTGNFGSACVYLPSDLEKWCFLIEEVVGHLVERYGVEEVQKWRFSPSAALYVSYNVFTMEEYLEYYLCTCNSIRKKLPNARIAGCKLDTGYVVLDGQKELVQFMEFCIEHDCMPDEFSFQCFQCDYSGVQRYEIEKKLVAKWEMQVNEPAKVSQNPNVLKEEIAVVRRILDAHGGSGKPIIISSWNSTIWQGDLGNDTCFKSAYIFKSFLENTEHVSGMSYNVLMDNIERPMANPNIFHGGTGLITYQGIPKGVYYGMYF